MRIFKEGGHRLFESDPQTVAAVGEMLLDLEKNGMDAVRKYSERFDGWNPKSFELSEAEIAEAAAKVPDQIRRDTEYSQANVRKFAQAQMEMFRDIEIEVRPGAVLGHKNIPVRSVCSYIPGGRYPLFGSAQMSIIPPKVAGVRNVYTSQQLLSSGNQHIYKIRNGYNPERNGDILIEVAPGWQVLNETNLKSHLSRASFTQFPIIIYGAGTKAERLPDHVTTDRIAPTISKAIRIRAPNACSAEPLF